MWDSKLLGHYLRIAAIEIGPNMLVLVSIFPCLYSVRDFAGLWSAFDLGLYFLPDGPHFQLCCCGDLCYKCYAKLSLRC